jgi:Spy/CpxP family protein refolding chaperone
MKTPSNFEALFLAAAVMATAASYATAEVPVQTAPAIVKAARAPQMPPMQVVVIKGHRLTAAQKAAL